MAAEWSEMTLRTVGVRLLDCEHRTPPPAPSGYPYIAIPQIRDGRLDLSDVRRITQNHYVDWTRKTCPQANDVIVVRRCNPGDTAFVPPGLECALGQNLVLLRADGTRVLPEFLRWLARSPAWWEQIQTYLNVGAVFDSLRCQDIPNFTLPIPPLAEQRAIASILGALDDKIELNHRVNETLEGIARALFKSWFVDFDPVRARAEGRQPVGMDGETAKLFPSSFADSAMGEIPNGWQVDSVHAIAEVLYGAPFASEHFNGQQRGLPLIRIRDLSTHDPEIFTEEHHPRAILIRPGDIVVGMDGEFRVHHWVGAPALMNQRVCSFAPKPNVPRRFVSASIAEPMASFERSKTGTTVIHVGKSDIDTIRVIVPTRPVLQAFGRVAEPLLKRSLSSSAESRTLAALRDILLPKLLSGEVRGNDAEQFLAGAIS